MNDDQELEAAAHIWLKSADLAWRYGTKIEDMEAATAAILMRALELATPDLSAEQRARLFQGEE